MSKREDIAIIQDIKEAIDRITSYTSQMEFGIRHEKLEYDN